MAPKKSKANKLAKMSDEERARYLQHRADIEEEARRRKQQLIATFMRNKLKREEAFARLNLAKINQHWRKILRDVKCKQMKEELMANWKNFERIMECKKITIEGMITELDEAEAQYANNLQAHMIGVDNLIEFHGSSLDQLRDDFLSKKRVVLDTGRMERECAEVKFDDDFVYLKRLHFSTLKYHGQQKRDLRDKHITSLNETKHDCIEDLQVLTSRKEAEIEALWKKYKDILTDHLAQTHDMRMEYTDLLKREVEDTCAIREHTDKVFQATNQIAKLKEEFLNFREEHKIKLEHLQSQKDEFLEHHRNMKKKMANGIARDKSQACVLVTSANRALKYLRAIRKKGDQLLYMFSLCSKFETEKEKLLPWGPNGFDIFIEDSQEGPEPDKQETDEDSSEFEHKIWKKDFHVEKMQKFWFRVNQVKIDCIDLSAEKKVLKAENNALKKILKNYLTELALSQNSPDQKTVLEDLKEDPLLTNGNPFMQRPLTGIEACTSIAVRYEARKRQKSCTARLRS